MFEEYPLVPTGSSLRYDFHSRLEQRWHTRLPIANFQLPIARKRSLVV
jgi:hypothetical protein